MLTLRVNAWAAWAPGVDTDDAWTAWAEAPHPLDGPGDPEGRSIPSLLRRRCSRLTRMLVDTALRACPPDARDGVRLVLASRHGEMTTTYALLEALARDEAPSPARFSHAVHNAPAGIFSVVTGNRVGARAIAAGRETFASGLVEAAAALAREPERPVLLVVGDEPVPGAFARFSDEVPCSYALALRLGPTGAEAGSGDGSALHVRLEAHAPPAAEHSEQTWPHALSFLRWWLAPSGAFLRLPADRRRVWVCTRA